MDFKHRPVALAILMLLSWALACGPAAAASAPPPTDPPITLSQPLTVRWKYESNSTLNLTPATDPDHVYLPLAGGVLVSLRTGDGQLSWRADVGGELSASPVADAGGVYVASETTGAEQNEKNGSGALRSLGREGGITIWKQTLPTPLGGALAISPDMLFGGAADGRVYAFRRETGEIAWTLQYSSPFASRPVVSGSRLFIGSDDGTLFALDRQTGRVAWRYRTQGALRSRPSVLDGAVYLGSADGYVYALDESQGRLRWRTRTGAGIEAVDTAREGVLAASLDNFVYLFSFARGSRIWKRQLPGRPVSQPLTLRDSALVTPLAGDAGVVLNLRDGKPLNNIPIGADNATAASPVLAGNLLVMTTRRGLLAYSRPGASAQARVP